MRFGQFITLSVFCRVFAFVVAMVLGGCELYYNDDTVPDDEPDAGVVLPPDAFVPSPDAEVLEACSEVCAGEEYNEWLNPDGSCAYIICRPSYGHCACPLPLLETRLYAVSNSSVAVEFHVNCPADAPNGPHRGGVELYANDQVVSVQSFDWTCAYSTVVSTWLSLPCGADVWARGVALHPATGNPVYLVTPHITTDACR
jgi:hypothetical protein